MKLSKLISIVGVAFISACTYIPKFNNDLSSLGSTRTAVSVILAEESVNYGESNFLLVTAQDKNKSVTFKGLWEPESQLNKLVSAKLNNHTFNTVPLNSILESEDFERYLSLRKHALKELNQPSSAKHPDFLTPTQISNINADYLLELVLTSFAHNGFYLSSPAYIKITDLESNTVVEEFSLVEKHRLVLGVKSAESREQLESSNFTLLKEKILKLVEGLW